MLLRRPTGGIVKRMTTDVVMLFFTVRESCFCLGCTGVLPVRFICGFRPFLCGQNSFSSWKIRIFALL